MCADHKQVVFSGSFEMTTIALNTARPRPWKKIKIGSSDFQRG